MDLYDSGTAGRKIIRVSVTGIKSENQVPPIMALTCEKSSVKKHPISHGSTRNYTELHGRKIS